MKNSIKNLAAVLVIALLIFLPSCKKGGEPQPQVVTNTVTVHDTVIIHDSASAPLPLQGIWKLYKLEDYNSGSLVATNLYTDWIFTFGSTTVNEVLGSSGTYNYNITYNAGSVDIYSTTPAINYSVVSTNGGSEYKLIKFPGTGNYQIWYFKK